MDRAKEEGLDLVEVAQNADPPVARIVDFKKLRYEEGKKEKPGKKGGRDLKELWLSPRIADHDLNVRLKRTAEFFRDGHKVKLSVKFKGREMAHPEFGHQLLQKAIAHFGDTVEVEREAKFEGRKLSVIIARSKHSLLNSKGGNKNAEDEDKQNNKQENEADGQGEANETQPTGGGNSQDS